MADRIIYAPSNELEAKVEFFIQGITPVLDRLNAYIKEQRIFSVFEEIEKQPILIPYSIASLKDMLQTFKEEMKQPLIRESNLKAWDSSIFIAIDFIRMQVDAVYGFFSDGGTDAYDEIYWENMDKVVDDMLEFKSLLENARIIHEIIIENYFNKLKEITRDMIVDDDGYLTWYQYYADAFILSDDIDSKQIPPSSEKYFKYRATSKDLLAEFETNGYFNTRALEELTLVIVTKNTLQNLGKAGFTFIEPIDSESFYLYDHFDDSDDDYLLQENAYQALAELLDAKIDYDRQVYFTGLTESDW